MKFIAVFVLMLLSSTICQRHIFQSDLRYSRNAADRHHCSKICMEQQEDVRINCVACCHQAEESKRYGLCISRYAKLMVNLNVHI